METLRRTSIKLLLAVALCVGCRAQNAMFFGLNVPPAGGGGGGSSISTTPGGKCKASAADTCTLDVSTPTGAVLIVGISSDGTFTGAASACTAGGNALTHVTSQAGGNAAWNVDMWYLQNTPSGITSVSCTLASGTSSRFFAQWFSGASTSAALDNSCTGTTASPCTVTTALANELIFGVGVYAGGQDTCTGYTSINYISFNNDNEVQSVAAGAAGSYSPAGCGYFANFTAHAFASFK